MVATTHFGGRVTENASGGGVLTIMKSQVRNPIAPINFYVINHYIHTLANDISMLITSYID